MNTTKTPSPELGSAHASHVSLTARQIMRLVRRAEHEGRRLQRKLGLPSHMAEDVQQDLLVDLLARLPKYDPARGNFESFTTIVLRHQSTRLARRHCEAFTAQGGATLPLSSLDEGSEPIDWISSHATQQAALHERLCLGKATRSLRPCDRLLCLVLSHGSVASLARTGFASRSSIYRRIHRLRPQLILSGFGPGWDSLRSA